MFGGSNASSAAREEWWTIAGAALFGMITYAALYRVTTWLGARARG
jgi:hypothetical protein